MHEYYPFISVNEKICRRKNTKVVISDNNNKKTFDYYVYNIENRQNMNFACYITL